MSATPAAAGTIHFYSINKRGQFSELMVVRGWDKPGCHGFPFARNVSRVALAGFKACALYRERNCAEGSEIPARWKGKDDPVTELTPGSRWFLADRENVDVRSWRCDAE